MTVSVSDEVKQIFDKLCERDNLTRTEHNTRVGCFTTQFSLIFTENNPQSLEDNERWIELKKNFDRDFLIFLARALEEYLQLNKDVQIASMKSASGEGTLSDFATAMFMNSMID